MSHRKLAAVLVLGLLAAGCQEVTRAMDKTIGAGASTSSLTPADAEFALRAAYGGSAEVTLGELAQTNAASSEVKAFGQKMIQDHTRLNQDLGTIVRQRGLTPPTGTTAPDQAVAAALGTRMGTAFDQAYLAQQVGAHEMTLALFQHAAQNAEDPAVRSFARRESDTIREHLRQAQSLLRKVRAAAS
jgi:putative membrane protein